MARILWSSNAPWAATGYGRQTAYCLRGIRDLGHEIACLAWYGLEGGSVTWEGIPIWPKQLDPYGNDAMFYRIKKWHPDVLITLIDLWVMDANLGNATRHCPWFPIDHADPIPPPIAQKFDSAHRLLVYSRYAERVISEHEGGKYKAKLRYIPHGTPCSIFRPLDSPEQRTAIRKRFYPDWPADAFIVGMVAANKGYPSRKSFPEAFEAFAKLHARHPNARLYLHSHVGSEFKGPDLQQFLKMFGLQDVARFANPNMLLTGDLPDDHMREVYGTFDVLLAPSQGEGFGLPLIESQACGIPIITTDHSAMSELCGSGWQVKPLRLTPSLIGGWFAEADVDGVHHALEECYRRPESTVRGMAAMAREFALRYDWPTVMRDYWKPFLEEIDAGKLSLTRQIHDERHPHAPLAPVAGNGNRKEWSQHLAWEGLGILTKYPEYAREKAEQRASERPAPEPVSVSESATQEQEQEAVAPV